MYDNKIEIITLTIRRYEVVIGSNLIQIIDRWELSSHADSHRTPKCSTIFQVIALTCDSSELSAFIAIWF